MNPALLQAIITQVALPEILGIVRAHHAATGEMPTDEQVIAKFNFDVDAGIKRGEDFLGRS